MEWGDDYEGAKIKKCKRVTLRWFVDVAIGGRSSDTGWVVGFNIGAKELLWVPPADRDYGRGRNINTNQKRALVRRASKEHPVDLARSFEMTIDTVEGV